MSSEHPHRLVESSSGRSPTEDEVVVLFQEIQRVIADEFGSHIAEAYLHSAMLKAVGLGEFEIITTSKLSKMYLEEKFKGMITELLRQRTNQQQVSLKFVFDPEISKLKNQEDSKIVKRLTKPAETRSAENKAALTNSSLSLLNSKYTFDSYIVGNGNQFSHAAAKRVAEAPGAAYNPLFIYGGVGLGKTHLLHAIGNEILSKNSGANILYLSSEAFTNELIQSLQRGTMDQFKQKMRAVEVLLIDDIQFMDGKVRTQEEFFHTFNTLYGLKHQIVLTSDKPPSAISGIEERLQTRFYWGLTADLQAPDFETRVAILKQKAEEESFELPSEVAVYIAKKVSSNVRELEGALTRVHAMSALRREPITAALAESSLQPLLAKKQGVLSIDDIKKVVASKFGIRVSDLSSKSRTKNLSFPRHIAMYLCRKHTTYSYPEIASHFGGRDHSTVVHAASVVSTKLKVDKSLQERIIEIEKALGI